MRYYNILMFRRKKKPPAYIEFLTVIAIASILFGLIRIKIIKVSYPIDIYWIYSGVLLFLMFMIHRFDYKSFRKEFKSNLVLFLIFAFLTTLFAGNIYYFIQDSFKSLIISAIVSMLLTGYAEHEH